MNILTSSNVSSLRAVRVEVTNEALIVDLSDGRTISAPIVWYPRLLWASKDERDNHLLIGMGEGIHWPDLDEDISIEGILCGRHSMESSASFSAWLESRTPNSLES